MTMAWMVGFAARFPRLADRARRLAVERFVPFNRRLGIRVIRAAADSPDTVLRLPFRRANLNVAGTVHGAAILALAETVHGVAVLWRLYPAPPRKLTNAAPLVYLAPARGPLEAFFRIEDATRDAIAADLASSGRSEVVLRSIVRDAGGREVARLEATYVIRRVAAG